MTPDDLKRLKDDLIARQRVKLGVTLEGLPTAGNAGIQRSAKKLANELRIRQLTKEEGMQDLFDVIIDSLLLDTPTN